MALHETMKMPSNKGVWLIFIIVVALLMSACTIPSAFTCFRATQNHKETFALHEGIMAEHAKSVKFREGRAIKAKVKLDEPVIISESGIPFGWGYYQFPSIYRLDDGNLLVTWQMKEDSYEALRKTDVGKNKMLSTDNGKTWIDYDNRYSPEQYSYSVKRSNGECLLIENYASKPLSTVLNFPKPVSLVEEKGSLYTYYREKELPGDMQGLNIKTWNLVNSTISGVKRYHTAINDEDMFRRACNDYIVLWNGRVRELSNHDIVACNWTFHHADKSGKIKPSGVSFYKLNEENKTWLFQGEMSYTPDSSADPHGGLRKTGGYSEPTFVELANGGLLCVARSSHETELTPLYKSVSDDEGKTWSKPEPFTPNGVDPSLIRLGNGTLVLATGRPGVQLRFCFDGVGKKWTEPIEMMPYPRRDGKIVPFGGSCGYTELLPNDKNSFFVVYSRFEEQSANGKYNGLDGVYKKTIIIRKITVKHR